MPLNTGACIAVYSSENLLHEKVKETFALYDDLAKKLYALCLLMKSQKTLELKNFDNALLDYILAWDAAFPGKPYFNKLHFLMMHLPDFVEEYGICGRVSAESHESVHTMMAKSKEAMKRMASTKQKYRTLFARATANSSSIFSSTETVNGEEYLVLFGGQGRIHSKYRDQFLYVKTGRAPDDWVDGFLQTELC
mmetsp:Transcript_26553/g.57045  ORF Transcript_26553/g.57045 Transcript_26553/m.57045 type:complete len:194 (+) Transcript_26553:2645-3226(+)